MEIILGFSVSITSTPTHEHLSVSSIPRHLRDAVAAYHDVQPCLTLFSQIVDPSSRDQYASYPNSSSHHSFSLLLLTPGLLMDSVINGLDNDEDDCCDHKKQKTLKHNDVRDTANLVSSTLKPVSSESLHQVSSLLGWDVSEWIALH